MRRAVAEADRRLRGPRLLERASRASSSRRARARRSSLGLGQGENFVASDPVALVPWTRDVVFLEDGDVARVDATGVRIVRRRGPAAASAPPHRILWDAVAAEKGGYRHFMAKEIHEQPTAVAETLGGKVSLETGELYARLAAARRPSASRSSTACCCSPAGRPGTPALVGKFLIEGMARIPVEVDYGSEFRYRARSSTGGR